MKGVYLLIMIPFFCGYTFGFDPMPRETVEKTLQTSPTFTIYKDNYFLTGTTPSEVPSIYNSDAKFQISMKYKIANQPLFFGVYSFITYTQKSYWDIYQESKPFDESNYNPSLHLLKPIFKRDGYANSFILLSVEHESNGLAEEYTRSWNYVACEYSHIVSKHISASLKLWLPFGLDENSDLMEYIGYGELSLEYEFIENRFYADLKARKGTDSWKGNMQFDVKFRPLESRNQYIMVQWWYGYAENLVNYRVKEHMLRLGIVLRPSFYRFY